MIKDTNHVTSIELDKESVTRGGSVRRAICTCGWLGAERATIEMASDDAIVHERKFDQIRKEPKLPWKRSCNRHEDCDQADRDTILGHGRPADHCDDECCEDCFGY